MARVHYVAVFAGFTVLVNLVFCLPVNGQATPPLTSPNAHLHRFDEAMYRNPSVHADTYSKPLMRDSLTDFAAERSAFKTEELPRNQLGGKESLLVRGAFAPSWQYAIKRESPGWYYKGLVSGDWMGDGKPQILVLTGAGVLVLDQNGKKQALVPVDKQIEILALGRTSQGPLLIGFTEWGDSVEAYDRQGKRLWRYKAAEDAVDWAAVVDIGDSKGDAVAIGYNGDGGIRLLDATGGLLWHAEGPGNVWSVSGARLSRSGPASVVAVDSSGPALVYDAHGTRVRELKPCESGAVYGADLDGDGVDEVLVFGTTVSSGQYLWVFEANGKLRWRRKAYASSAGSITTGRFQATGVQIAVGYGDGTVFMFGSDGTLLPGLKVKHDLTALCTLRQQGSRDALIALTTQGVVCYRWQPGKAAGRPILPEQDKTDKDFPESPFVRAVQQNHLAQAQALLEQGADPNGKNSQGSPVLIVAAHRDHAAMAQLLLEKGAEVNAHRKDGKTALMVAIEDGHSEVARLLIQRGAAVNTKYRSNGMELTALMSAAMSDQTEVVEALLKAGAQANAPGMLERTPIFWTKRIEIAALLLAHGATLDARDRIGETPLMAAVQDSNVEMVRFLIARGANVNARTDASRHLYFAAWFVGDKETQKKLEQSGKLKVRREDGPSVLEMAKFYQNGPAGREIIEMLEKAGARVPPLP